MNRQGSRLLTYIIFLFLITKSFLLSAQPEIRAIKIENRPQLDGSLTDACWQNIDPVNEFYQREPVPGDPATFDTKFYFGYDAHFLYVAIQCDCDPDEITAKEMARDVNLGNDDRIQVILDTHNDKRNAYWFQIGPRGSIGDALISENGSSFNKAWDGLWSGKAKITEKGWEAELAIPFKSLNFDRDLSSWGLKLIRYQKSREEMTYWPSANVNNLKFQVSDAGLLTGLDDISQGVGLDLVPYGLGGIDFNDASPKGKLIGDAGFEAYYNITPGIKAAVTVNTDFAQTEVDQQEINLTRFSLFYPEKRDFFLDGANYFNFGISGDDGSPVKTKLVPFFSRRIGLDGAGNPIPVQYGGKVTGQAGPWNIGAMYMKDLRAGWKNGNFGVSRLSRNIGKQSQIGLISSYGNALYDSSNFLVGLDMKLATSQFMGDKNLSFVAYGLKSLTESQINSGRDLSFGAEFNYPNDKLAIRLGHMQIQENFVAGIGFVPRPGVKQTYGQVTLGYRPGKWGLMQILASGGFDYIHDFEGLLLNRDLDATPIQLRFLSGDGIKYQFNSSYEFLDSPFNLYGNYPIAAGEYTFFYQRISFESAKRRNLWGTVAYRAGSFYDGTRNEIKIQAGYKVAVPLFIGGELIRNDISLESGGFIANVYRMNLNILFSPDITLYTFVQYDSQSDKMGWQSRFQWIIKPGKEIFLVWNSIARDPYERYQMEEGSLRLKVKYTVRF